MGPRGFFGGQKYRDQGVHEEGDTDVKLRKNGDKAEKSLSKHVKKWNLLEIREI